MGVTWANDFPYQVDEHGQAAGNHPRSRSDLDDAERDASIYGSVSVVPGSPGWIAVRIGVGGLGDSLRIWPLVCVPFF